MCWQGVGKPYAAWGFGAARACRDVRRLCAGDLADAPDLVPPTRDRRGLRHELVATEPLALVLAQPLHPATR